VVDVSQEVIHQNLKRKVEHQRAKAKEPKSSRHEIKWSKTYRTANRNI
jgi:hypothetical protein